MGATPLVVMQKVTVVTLREMKQRGEKIVSLTAYDATFSRLLDSRGVDAILVGDSLGMVVQGLDSTIPVSLDEMIYHTRVCARGVERALLIADLPFMTYQRSAEQALDSAGRLMKEGAAHMVKLEGGEVMADTVRCLVERGIPVCGHLGLTPQSVHSLGGYRVQGKTDAAAERILHDARCIADAGASIIVLEAMPAAVAARITEAIEVPTIGIGAGPACDGQVLVLHDMLGLGPGKAPRFVKDFMHGARDIGDAVGRYVAEVRSGAYPAPEHCYAS